MIIYGLLGRATEAVELALQKVGVELAMEQANKPEDEEVRKRLWLRIARHSIAEMGSHDKDSVLARRQIDTAMGILKKCGDLLKIEDILPFFPNFVLIDDFKEEIEQSLNEYGCFCVGGWGEVEERNEETEKRNVAVTH